MLGGEGFLLTSWATAMAAQAHSIASWSMNTGRRSAGGVGDRGRGGTAQGGGGRGGGAAGVAEVAVVVAAAVDVVAVDVVVVAAAEDVAAAVGVADLVVPAGWGDVAVGVGVVGGIELENSRRDLPMGGWCSDAGALVNVGKQGSTKRNMKQEWRNEATIHHKICDKR